jgi:hypothetical protein
MQDHGVFCQKNLVAKPLFSQILNRALFPSGHAACRRGEPIFPVPKML